MWGKQLTERRAFVAASKEKQVPNTSKQTGMRFSAMVIFPLWFVEVESESVGVEGGRSWPEFRRVFVIWPDLLFFPQNILYLDFGFPPYVAPDVSYHTTPPPNFSSRTLSNRPKFPFSKTTSSLLLNLLGSRLIVEVSSSSFENKVGRCTRESTLRTKSSEEVIDSIEGGEEVDCDVGIIAMRCCRSKRVRVD